MSAAGKAPLYTERVLCHITGRQNVIFKNQAFQKAPAVTLDPALQVHAGHPPPSHLSIPQLQSREAEPKKVQ